MAAILKIDILLYLSEKSSDFHEILYTAADFKLDERHVIKMKKFHWIMTERQNVFLVASAVPFTSEIIEAGLCNLPSVSSRAHYKCTV